MARDVDHTIERMCMLLDACRVMRTSKAIVRVCNVFAGVVIPAKHVNYQILYGHGTDFWDKATGSRLDK